MIQLNGTLPVLTMFTENSHVHKAASGFGAIETFTHGVGNGNENDVVAYGDNPPNQS